MKVLLDTSVFIAAVLDDHIHHKSAWTWLDEAKAGKFLSIVSGLASLRSMQF